MKLRRQKGKMESKICLEERLKERVHGKHHFPIDFYFLGENTAE